MADFNVRSDSVNVEQIMEQIRARIREKRGVDYTEQQIRDLAAVKLEKFLDPKGVRSDLLEQFRKAQLAYEPPELPNYAFEGDTIYETHRGPLRFIRRLLNPILKLFFNPTPLIQALHIQSRLNTMYAEREARREAARRATDQLNYELIHNLVIEVTRNSIEVKNLKMRVESLSSRLEFNERRARALESVVVYKPSSEAGSQRGGGTQPLAQQAQRPQPQPAQPSHAQTPQPQQPSPQGGPQAEGPGQRSRRRRRRRGRRSGAPAAAVMGGQQAAPDSEAATDRPPHDDAAEPSEPRAADAAHEAGSPTAPATEDLQNMTGAASHPSEPPDRDSQ
jgi:hypothetical protein